MIKTKSIYETAAPEDGLRVLVTRYWPRGVKKERINIWCRDLSPSPELIKNYKSGEVTWQVFKAVYLAEIDSEAFHKCFAETVSMIKRRADSTATLLCTCKDDSRCHRSILAALLEGEF